VSFKSTQRNPEVFGFFYDELASMLNNANLCSKFEVSLLELICEAKITLKLFQQWLSGKVAETFEELYIHDSNTDPKSL
jgi:hypothetical protein